MLAILLVALLCQLAYAGPVLDAEFAAYKEEHPEEFGDLFEGDMIVDGNFRNGIQNKNLLWTGGVVPYEVGSGYTRQDLANIDKAVAEFKKHTCIRWVKRTNQQSYVKIHRGGGCSSAVGMNSRGGYPQMLSLGHGCTGVGTIIHEMLHAIGFVHEQCRTDRDSYITIYWQNIIQSPSNMSYNFVKHGGDYISLLNTAYDYGSVMHYGAKAFSVNGRDTIVPKQRGAAIGQRSGFSALDIARVKALYKCGGGGGVVVPPVSSCTDDNQHCQAWASSGECVNNPSYMMKQCKKSCGACGVPECRDSNKDCAYWAGIGECFKNHVWMLDNCKESCKQC